MLWGLRAWGLLWVLGVQEAGELLGSRVVQAGDSWVGEVRWQM